MAEKKKKKETFGQAFKRNRKKFMDSGKANDYTFKYEGKDYNVRQKGETEKGLLAKYVKSAPKKSVRPKTRPVATPSATTSKDKGSSYEERQRQLRKDKAAAAKRKAIRRSSAASKTLGTDPAPTKAKPKRKADGVPARLREKTTDGLPKGIGGMNNRIDEPGAPFLGSKGGKSAALRRKDVKEGQAKYRDRAGPQRRARDVTFAEWKGMSRAKRKMLGLPVSFLGGEIGFNRLRKGFTGKDSTRKTK